MELIPFYVGAALIAAAGIFWFVNRSTEPKNKAPGTKPDETRPKPQRR